jgi:ketosteroid isomerase-like protein
MSQANVEIVRQAIEANRSDNLEALRESIVAFWDPSCEFTSVMAAVEPETYRGHDGLRRYLNDLVESWGEWRNEVEDVFEAGPNTVVVIFRSHQIGKDSGAAVEARRAMVTVLSGGKLLRARVYPSREEALEAVRSSE